MSSHAKAERLERGFGVALWLCSFCLPALVLAQDLDRDDSIEPIAITTGETITTPQRDDEVVSYVFEAEAGQNYLIEVEQNGLDFIVTVEDPSGFTLSYNSPLMRDESEFVLLERARPGQFSVGLHSEEYTGADASHTITISLLEPLVSSDEIQAWRLMTLGAQSDAAGQPLSPESAATAYEEAARIWAELGQLRQQAQALYSLAMLEYWHLSDWNRSAEQAAAAARLYGELDHVALYGKAIHVEGYAMAEAATGLGGDDAEQVFDRALGKLFEAERIFEELLVCRFDLAQTKNNIGYTYFIRGDWESANPYWEQAARLYADLKEWRSEVQPLQNLAVVAAEQGRLGAAVNAFERILEALPGRLMLQRGTYLNNLAEAHRNLGNFDEAMRAFSRALDLHEAVDDFAGQGQSLVGLGRVYTSLGELDLAAEFLERALPISEQANDFDRQEVIFRYLGIVALERQDPETALDYHLRAVRNSSSDPTRARLNVLLARDLRALGRFEQAEERAREAWVLARESGAQQLIADASLEAGLAALGVDDFEQAQQSLTSALGLYQTLKLGAEQADALHGLSRLARSRGTLDEAIRYNESALTYLENSRSGVSDPELRAFYAGQRRAYYEVHLDLLMEAYAASESRSETYLRQMLEISERARARMLADLLAEASVDLDQQEGSQIEVRRGALYQDLAELRHQRDRLLADGVSGGRDEMALATIIGRMASVDNELNVLETEARGESGKSYSETLSASEIQGLIPLDSILLQYALGRKTGYVLLVETDRIRAIELADRNTIEDRARRAFQELAEWQSGAQARRQQELVLQELSGLVLQPVAGFIGDKRLLISPDGPLQYIPFGTLSFRGGEATSRLIDSHELAVIPSMTTVAAQRERVVESPPSKTLAIFADPVFNPADPRLGPDDASVSTVNTDPLPITVSSNPARSIGPTDRYLARLPSTGAEAEAIAALVPEKDRLVAVGFDASIENIQRSDLGGYRYLHFATHGLIDSRYPALSALALSQFDADGANISGFLRLHDIFGMSLNAELVVLSACDTALGREIRGEGLIGLTQGFLYAGAKGLIVSLWQVPDQATSELMARFYRYLLRDGLDPSAALRRAQLSIASESRWNDPYFWSSFILVSVT